jgi:excinuclease ABC subunit C
MLRDGDRPDLLVIDGGKGQLSAAYGVVMDVRAKASADKQEKLDFDLVSLAKSRIDKKGRKTAFMDTSVPERSFERVFFPDRELPLALATATPEYRLLTQIRDEAHRFAITHHRKRRAKIAHESVLDTVPGVGPALRRLIIATFGGMDGLKRATLDQLCAVKGLRESSAVTLYGLLQSEAEVDDVDEVDIDLNHDDEKKSADTAAHETQKNGANPTQSDQGD